MLWWDLILKVIGVIPKSQLHTFIVLKMYRSMSKYISNTIKISMVEMCKRCGLVSSNKLNRISLGPLYINMPTWRAPINLG